MISDQFNIPKTICQSCILPGTFPGIDFDEHGICKYCRKESVSTSKNSEKKTACRARLDALINAEKDTAPVYDLIMAYSGGKDSSYTLKFLKEKYNLRIMALTFDNHFVSSTAMENIRTITDALNVDSLIWKTPWSVMKRMFSLTAQKDIFPAPTLIRASSICTACIGLVKSIVLKTALEMAIPLVGFGWSPGQAPLQSAILKVTPSMTRTNQMVLKNAFPKEMLANLNRYFIPESYYNTYKEKFPVNVHPLAFFDYDEEFIIKNLQESGWKNPKDTDTNSSNCLINAYANKCHMDRHGFHPYVWEIANMVRQGVMTRDEGLKKIYNEQDSEMILYAEKRLMRP